MMKSQMKMKYEKSMALVSAPVSPSQLPNVHLDLKGVMAYAKKKGVQVTNLSVAEKQRFISKL